MLVPESLGNVAAPTDWAVRGQGVLQVFRGDIVPCHGLVFLIQQGGRMVVPVEFSEWFVAKRAGLPLIPLVYDRCNQACLWRFLDLRQTPLRASFALRPTGARGHP
jgi:hypothetical protein